MKYSNYIELSANYESVVDLDAEERNPNLWQEYIVHGDMQRAMEAVCQTILWEDNDKRRSFWIHGAYGTGKSYAAIVLKHLFEDSIANIDSFLNKPSLAEYRKRFIKIREKGDFLVVWTSGATDIKSGTHLMMEMEVKIKEKLAEKFGGKAYYGTSSLINAAKDAINDKSINWEYLFTDLLYGLSDQYSDIEEFQQAVLDGDSDAIHLVKRICDDNHRNMFTGVVDRFEEWIKDIIAGNGLQETGIVFIWDEFTGFLRDCGDDNVLQRLSEFCKSVDKDGKTKQNAPFFMCLIVHHDPTWVSELGEETYERILHRYHKLEFHITESAAYDLIGDSIIPRPGMAHQWEDIKKDLLKSIQKYNAEFDNLDQSININERMSKLCPIHPMTLSMLATVAQNFGASQRTLFRFMKDRNESSEGVGFIHYIENNEPDKWQWLTADYLWDYFFTRGSDVRDFSAETRKVIQHFQNKSDSISDEYAIHVFKAALLLIAVMSGSNISNLYSKQSHTFGRSGATRNTLYKCFRGQLEQATIDEYLTSFKEIGLLSLGEQSNGDVRLELPYTGNTDTFDVRLEMTQKKYTRYALFSDKGVFSKALESAMWDNTRATFGRVYIAACSSETTSLSARLGEIKKELQKFPYKIGILVVVVSEASEYTRFQTKIKQIAAEDDSNRLVVTLLREPCTAEIIDRWHKAITHKELCADDGKTGDAGKYDIESSMIVATWAGPSADSQISAYYGEIQYTGIYGKSDLMKRIEKDVLFDVFPAAPERLVTVNTAYKKCNSNVVLTGITKAGSNNQVNNIVNALKTVEAWDVNDLDTLKNLSGSSVEPISSLATFFQQELAQGAKIPIDVLWAKLQQPPFGYYNSMAVGCFIGLAIRSLVNGTFNWFDGVNTLPPTAGNLASMVNKMLDGKTINHNLSSGSAIWQKFKQYIQKIFMLSPQESVSEAEARKFIRQKTIVIGVPVWALKYMGSDKFGGDESKAVVIKLTDLLCDFIYETTEDQESVMAEVLTQFNGRGQLRQVITNALWDKSAMLSAFRRFMFSNIGELETLSERLNLNDKDIFDALRIYLQDSISAWRETQVIEKLGELAQEFGVIATVNSEIGVGVKTYRSVQNTLNNVFENMKVPGTVIETLPVSWIPALKQLREISKSSWAELTNKESVVSTLEGRAKTAWEHLSKPKLLLEAIFNARQITYTDDELEEIYTALKQQSYETPVSIFDVKLNGLLENIKHNRDSAAAKKQWQDISGTASIQEWCNNNNVPIIWLFDETHSASVRTIRALQDGRAVDKDALTKALSFLKGNNLAVLQDTTYISDRFFAYIGENYRAAFISDRKVLIDRLKTNAKLSSDVYSWETKIPEIRATLDTYLQKTYQEQAKTRVKTMSDEELRNAVLKLLDMNPELYNNFLN
ncbi:hypothetical protein [Parasporobacterium paucivorans]|uniref:Uncharacterized protein n=1 Tax=Parasporobacterium paucivorans DSM 15970 TaxID=1122934 RepID=A0A1M6AZP9_9FIRM|nr:hypothetical protein [Parasporobacterium paucivorans]SHI41932.1 hypothetical protein SAMN02745691_00222 [Parasporobacterium paucivorans DSM 15970]